MSLLGTTSLTAPASLRLHKMQREVFDDEHRFRVVVAGRRWGKTQLARISIVDAATVPRQLIWYVAPTYQMARGILWDELKESIPRAWILSINETRMTIRLINKTRIELKGSDKPDTLRGVGINFLVMDEVQDQDVETWTLVLRATLASTRGRVLFIGTPKSFNWFHDLYVRGQRGNDGPGTPFTDKDGKLRRNHWRSWQFPTITSPFIPASEIAAARADMDEKSFKQEFEASFETMSGRVYHVFDRKIHVGNYPFNPRLPIEVGMDFNIDPMSAVIMQEQSNGETWIVDEIVMFGSNTQEMAEELERRYFQWQKGVTIYPDPAGAAGSTKGRGKSDLDILSDSGFKRWRYKRKHPKVSDRVNAVNRKFKAADGTIGMRVNHICKNTIKAFEETIYKPGTREVDKTQGTEHPADAAGYYIDLRFPVIKKMIGGLSI